MEKQKSFLQRIGTTKHLVITGVILVLVAVGLVTAVVKAGGFGVQFNLSESAFLTLIELIKPDKESLGAQPGPDSFNPVECNQEICRGYVKQQLVASTTPCSLRNPLKATSTILSFSANIRGSAYGADVTFSVSTSTNNGGSSTPALVFSRTLVSGANDDVLWTPSFFTSTTTGDLRNLGSFTTFDTRGENRIKIAPNDYITLRIATATPGSFGAAAINGSCRAQFLEI